MRAGARLFLLVLSCLLLLAATPDTEQPLSGYSAASSRTRARLGSKIPRHPRAAEPARLHAAARRPSAPCRLALRQGQRRMDARQIQGVGPRREHREFRCSVSHAKRASRGTGRADQIHRQAAGAGPGRRSHLEPASRATSHLQRLLRRRRRDRAAGLRQLRHSRGLRETGATGRLGQGRDRDRALRKFLARHQAQGCGRARRRRMPDLFRSGRRWLRSGRRLSRRARGVRATACSAAA